MTELLITDAWLEMQDDEFPLRRTENKHVIVHLHLSNSKNTKGFIIENLETISTNGK